MLAAGENPRKGMIEPTTRLDGITSIAHGLQLSIPESIITEIEERHLFRQKAAIFNGVSRQGPAAV